MLSSNGTNFHHWGGYKGMEDNYNTDMGEARSIVRAWASVMPSFDTALVGTGGLGAAQWWRRSHLGADGAVAVVGSAQRQRDDPVERQLRLRRQAVGQAGPPGLRAGVRRGLGEEEHVMARPRPSNRSALPASAQHGRQHHVHDQQRLRLPPVHGPVDLRSTRPTDQSAAHLSTLEQSRSDHDGSAPCAMDHPIGH